MMRTRLEGIASAYGDQSRVFFKYLTISLIASDSQRNFLRRVSVEAVPLYGQVIKEPSSLMVRGHVVKCCALWHY